MSVVILGLFSSGSGPRVPGRPRTCGIRLSLFLVLEGLRTCVRLLLTPQGCLKCCFRLRLLQVYALATRTQPDEVLLQVWGFRICMDLCWGGSRILGLLLKAPKRTLTYSSPSSNLFLGGGPLFQETDL